MNTGDPEGDDRWARDQDWDTLIWCVVSPQCAGRMRDEAIEEIVRRTGSEEAALKAVQERVELGVSIGTLNAWSPGSRRRNTT